MTGNPPVEVQSFGQSIWYDNIRRSLLDSGELQRLIDQHGVLGVTSNPTIFQRAIGESDDYDAALQAYLDLDSHAIYEHLAIEDIQRAADMLLPAFQRTGGRDGYVCLEVSPLLANDTESTVAEARRLFETIDRPNTMIKIPATEAGIPAIQAAIAAGININVTLIFAVSNYLQVAEAYLSGLEERLAAGQDIDKINSVASFFLSRIDATVDRMLENNIRAAQGRDLDRVAANRKLLGRAALANARLAYSHFKRIFESPRFVILRDSGATVQRLLWASTRNRNPAYSDTYYVDHFIAENTVNTLQPETLAAFIERGKVDESLLLNRLGEGSPLDVLETLAEVGVDLEQITHQLQSDGVELFAESFENLLTQVDAKRQVLRTGIIQRQEVVLSIYGEAVQRGIEDIEARFVNTRIWEKDGSVWKGNNQVINAMRQRLGWLDLNQTIDRGRLAALQAEAGAWSQVVLLGMGGSSLAAEVLSQTFGPQSGYPTLQVLDGTNPDVIRSVESGLDLDKTLFIVASKSGTTVETRALADYFYERTAHKGEQFLAITDPETPLVALAQERGFRDTFLNPADVGGRYSALSYFGMVPAALLGLDLDALWRSADDMMLACGPQVSGQDHPGIWLGAIMGKLAEEGRDKVSVFTSPSIASMGDWIEQLIAESTGKLERGLIPVVGATVGNPHDYVTDRLFIYLRVDGDENESVDDGLAALQQAGQPCVTLRLPNRYALGGEFFRWEFAIAVAGHLLGINPFDEPNVAESKDKTAALLEQVSRDGNWSDEAALSDGALKLYADEKTLQLLSDLSLQQGYSANDILSMVAAQINSTRAGDYFGLLAFLPETAAVHEMMEDIRRRLRHTTHRAVTLGYGPRYLHSSGQLHKGGPNNGIFIMITADHHSDIAVPGQLYGFAALHTAQAVGDLQALQDHRRRVFRLHISGPVTEGLQTILDAIDLVDERRR